MSKIHSSYIHSFTLCFPASYKMNVGLYCWELDSCERD